MLHNMLYPSISELIKMVDSKYSLVIITAKRARQIAQEAEVSAAILREKPVALAVEEMSQGKLRIINMPETEE